jgi:hypothetical protein
VAASTPTADSLPQGDDDDDHDRHSRRQGRHDRPERLIHFRRETTMTITTGIRAGRGAMIDPNG